MNFHATNKRNDTIKITSQQKLCLSNRIKLNKSLSPAARLIGWLIVDHINEELGYAWPSQEYIAETLGLGRRTVQRAIKSLSGYFDINCRDGVAHRYTPLFNQRQNGAGHDDPTPVKMTPDQRQNGAGTGVKMTPYPLTDPLNDPVALASLGRTFAKDAKCATTQTTREEFETSVRLAILEPKLKKGTADSYDWWEARCECRIAMDTYPTEGNVFQRAHRMWGDYGLESVALSGGASTQQPMSNGHDTCASIET